MKESKSKPDSIHIQKETDSIFNENESERVELLSKKPASASSSGFLWKCCIIFALVLVAIVLIYIFFIRTGKIKAALQFIDENLKKLYRTHPYLTYSGILLLFLLNYLLLLPLRLIFFFICCSIFPNYYIPFFYSLFCCLAGSSAVFVLASTGIRPWLLGKFGSHVVFKVLLRMAKESPWRTAFLTRMLFITQGIKEYFLALVGVSFCSHITSAAVLLLFYNFQMCLIHHELGEIAAFMNSESVPWKLKSPVEKFSTITSVLFIVFTIVFMAYISYRLTRLVQLEREKLANDPDQAAPLQLNSDR